MVDAVAFLQSLCSCVAAVCCMYVYLCAHNSSKRAHATAAAQQQQQQQTPRARTHILDSSQNDEQQEVAFLQARKQSSGYQCSVTTSTSAAQRAPAGAPAGSAHGARAARGAGCSGCCMHMAQDPPVRIFWDHDNIAVTKATYASILQGLGAGAKVAACRVFGSNCALGSLLKGDKASERPADAVLCYDVAGSRKSLTDARLTVDAMMAAARHPHSHFVVVSDDAGYLPLVSALKELGHKVSVVTAVCKGSLVTEAAHAWLQLRGHQKCLDQNEDGMSSQALVVRAAPANAAVAPGLQSTAPYRRHRCDMLAAVSYGRQVAKVVQDARVATGSQQKLETALRLAAEKFEAVATKQEVLARSLQVLQHHVFLWLSNAMHVCPHSVYVNMGQFMANNPEYRSILGLPANLVLRQGKLKLSIVEGLEGSIWTRSEKAAVAQLLLKMDHAVLFSHLGSCQKKMPLAEDMPYSGLHIAIDPAVSASEKMKSAGKKLLQALASN